MVSSPPIRSAAAGQVETVSERTYRALHTMVLTGALPPGQVLEERKLAEHLAVSRTPLRIALGRLLGENLVTRLSNGLLAVRWVGVEEYLELVQVRRVLESEAARLAAGTLPTHRLDALAARIRILRDHGRPDTVQHWQLDDEVHGMIAKAAGNRRLARLIAEARREMRLCTIDRLPLRLAESCTEHLAILEALKQGDAEAAARWMAEHLDRVRRGFLTLLDQR